MGVVGGEVASTRSKVVSAGDGVVSVGGVFIEGEVAADVDKGVPSGSEIVAGVGEAVTVVGWSNRSRPFVQK